MVSIAVTGPVPVSNMASPLSSTSIGINLSGMEYAPEKPGVAGTTYVVPSTAELQYYQSQGLDLIRLPVSWQQLQPTLNTGLNSTYINQIQGVLDTAASLGMKVIIDLHNGGGEGNDKLGGTITNAEFADLWSRVSSTLSGNPGLGGYDIMNEPNNMPSASVWPGAAQAAIDAIRVHDASNRHLRRGQSLVERGRLGAKQSRSAEHQGPVEQYCFFGSYLPGQR